MAASTSWDYFSDYYIENDLYLKGDDDGEVRRGKGGNCCRKPWCVFVFCFLFFLSHLFFFCFVLFCFFQDGKDVLVRPPVMSPPPVLNLWNLYGVNVKTEIAYYYKETDHGLHLDERADNFKFVFFSNLVDYSHYLPSCSHFISSHYQPPTTNHQPPTTNHQPPTTNHQPPTTNSMKKVKDNPSGFAVSGGIAYEHSTTFQRTIRAHKSGDGTVPFFSLSQPSAWRYVGRQWEGEKVFFFLI